MVPPACPNNCTCDGTDAGYCVVDQGITQCQCNNAQHGSDCCSSGGISAVAKAGIATGIIVAIVLAGVIIFAVLSYGVKRGVDWVQIHNMNMSTAHDNPLHVPQTTEHTNPIHESV